MFVCLCVYIKQPLTAIGGGGGPAGVFALAAIQHSTFLCDIQFCDLRKPALQRSSLSLSLTFLLSLSLSLQPLSLCLPCLLPTFLCVSLFPSLSLDHLLHCLFIFELRKSSVIPPTQHPWFIFTPSVSLKVSPRRSPLFLLTEVPWWGAFLSALSLSTHPAAVTENSQHFTLYRSLNVSLRCIFLLYLELLLHPQYNQRPEGVISLSPTLFPSFSHAQDFNSYHWNLHTNKLKNKTAYKLKDVICSTFETQFVLRMYK